jgi:hypothetical protein
MARESIQKDYRCLRAEDADNEKSNQYTGDPQFNEAWPKRRKESHRSLADAPSLVEGIFGRHEQPLFQSGGLEYILSQVFRY